MKKNRLSLFGLIIIYFIVILSISVAYSFCNEQLSLSGNVTIKTETQNDYEYTIMESNSWQNNEYYYYQYTITVNYLGEKNIKAWNVYIDMPLDSIITGCYNANECNIENSVLKMDNASYNGNLDPNNNSFSIGFQFYTTSPSYELSINKIDFFTEEQNQDIDNPGSGEGDENEEDNQEISNELKEKIVFNMSTDNSWGNITSYTFSIENQSDLNLKSWEVQIEFNEKDSVSNLWGAQYIMKENILVLFPPTWSSSFSPSTKEQGGIQMIINSGVVPFKDFKILSIKVITSDMEEVIIK